MFDTVSTAILVDYKLVTISNLKTERARIRSQRAEVKFTGLATASNDVMTVKLC